MNGDASGSRTFRGRPDYIQVKCSNASASSHSRKRYRQRFPNFRRPFRPDSRWTRDTSPKCISDGRGGCCSSAYRHGLSYSVSTKSLHDTTLSHRRQVRGLRS